MSPADQYASLRAEFLQALLAVQNSKCGICGAGSDRNDLVLDHDHASGFIRGYLCHACNVSEGFHSCLEPGNCHVCFWRAHPAAAAVGMTLAYDGRSAWNELGGYQPTEKLVNWRTYRNPYLPADVYNELQAKRNAEARRRMAESRTAGVLDAVVVRHLDECHRDDEREIVAPFMTTGIAS